MPNENPGKNSVTDPTVIINRVQSVDNVTSCKKILLFIKRKKRSLEKKVRRWSSRNNEVLSFSEKFVLRDNISKSWI